MNNTQTFPSKEILSFCLNFDKKEHTITTKNQSELQLECNRLHNQMECDDLQKYYGK